MCFVNILYFVFRVIFLVDITTTEILYVAKDGNITFKCPFKSSNIVHWRGPPNRTLYSEKDIVNPEVKGIGITGENGDGEFNLVVYGFEEPNEGIYQCSTLINDMPAEENFNIRLQIRKPILSITINPSESVIEGSNVSVTCNGSSNPSPFVFRMLGPEGYVLQTNNVTNNTKSHVFTLMNIKRNATGNYTCTAENAVASGSVTAWLNVFYSPEVTITGFNYSQTESVRSLVCNAKGNPNTYKYLKWEHFYFHQHIRTLTGYKNGTLILPFINHTEKRHEDNGRYECKVGNGVPVNDKTGDLYQTAEILIQTTGSPTFLRRNRKTYYCKYGDPISIELHIYSIPQVTRVKLAKQKNNASVEFRAEKEKVTDTFHDKNVELLAYVATFRTPEINSEEYFTTYTIQAENKEGKSCFTLQLKDNTCYCPEVPRLNSVFPGTKSIMIKWSGGFNGGFLQTFVVEYKQESQEKWIDYRINITESDKNSYITFINDLLPHERYDVRMYAVNSMNRSIFTSVFKATTGGGASISNISDLPVYITIGLVLFLITSASVGYLMYKSGNLYRRRKYSANSNSRQGEGSTAFTNINDMSENRQSTVQEAAAATLFFPNFRSDIDEVLRTDRLVCEPLASQKKPLDQQPVKQELSELNYIEIELNHIPEGHRFYIHGQDNRTEYSEIEFGAIGDPLPPSESEMDDENDTDKIDCMVVRD